MSAEQDTWPDQTGRAFFVAAPPNQLDRAIAAVLFRDDRSARKLSTRREERSNYNAATCATAGRGQWLFAQRPNRTACDRNEPSGVYVSR